MTLATIPTSNPEHAWIESEIVKLQVDKGASATNAAVVERASAASDTSPSTAESIIGLSIGLVLALILVGLREAIDARVHSDAEVEAILSVPVLATIRSLPKNARLVTVGTHAALHGDAYAVLAARVATQDARSRGMLLAVTSAVASEGKTTTASNLGVALARRGNRVLIVDFDFRRSTLGRTFGIPADASGAVYVLDGIASIESALWQVDISGKAPVATPFMAPIRVAEPTEVPSVYQRAGEMAGEATGEASVWDTQVTSAPPAAPRAPYWSSPPARPLRRADDEQGAQL